MNESKVMKCPKCGGETKKGYVRGTGGQVHPIHFAVRVSFWGGGNREDTCALPCKNCGYVESYIERKG